MTNVKQDFIKVHCHKCSDRRLFDSPDKIKYIQGAAIGGDIWTML